MNAESILRNSGSSERKRKCPDLPEVVYKKAMTVFRNLAGTVSQLPATVASGYLNFYSESHKRIQKNTSIQSFALDEGDTEKVSNDDFFLGVWPYDV